MTPGRHRKCKATQPKRGFTVPNQIVLVVTDLMMDGWEMIDHLHARQRPPRIVVMTGYVPQEAKTILLDTRSIGYLTKPIEQIGLQVLLKATLRRGNLGRQIEAVVVEDDRTSLQTVAKTLAERGVYVVPFTSVEPAVKHIQESPPDLEIFDAKYQRAGCV